MPRVEQDAMPTSLHYALTDSQCSKCGGQLEWSANFDNFSQPKYTSKHCNQGYVIRIDSVKVEMVGETPKDEEKGKENVNSEATKDEPRAIQMAMKEQKQEVGHSGQQP
jgi:NAD-dependent SIR2 family protein deacetylase